MCPSLEKKLFYLDYGCLCQRCGMKLSSVSVTVITSCLHLLKPLFFLFCSDRASEPESEVHARCLFPTDFTDLHG